MTVGKRQQLRREEGARYILFAAPDPRKMAGRPVNWMAAIMAEGGVVPVVVSMEVGSEKVVEWMPGSCERAEEMSRMQASHSRGTEKVASYVGSILGFGEGRLVM